ncbi:MAG: GumC family protein, partial [Actinomycetota bacterium]
MSLASPSPNALPRPDLNLSTYVEIIRRRRAIFIQVFVMVVAIGLVITALSKPVYQTYAEILVPLGGPAVSIVDSKDPVNLILATARPEPIKTQVKILQGEPFQQEARKLANVTGSPDDVPPTVSVEPLEGLNVIRVTVEGGNPKGITALANAIVDLHLERTDLLTTTGIDKTIEFVENEKKRVAAELKVADQKLIDFRRTHRVAQLTAEQAANAQEYTQLQAAVQAAKSNLASTQLQLKLLEDRLAKEPLEQVLESSKENVRLPRLQERLDTLQFQREDLLRNYKPTHRAITDLDAQIAKLTAQIAAEPAETVTQLRTANPLRATLQTRIAELEASQETYQTALNVAQAEFNAKQSLVNNDFGLWEMELTRRTSLRDRLQAQDIDLDGKLRDLELRANTRIRTARILESAHVPTSPIKPKKATNMMLAIILALCLAAAMAFLQEFLDDRVNAPSDLERFSAAPALGHVPMMDDANLRLLSALPANSQVAEAYRALRSTIGFAGIDTPLKRLLVTSSSKGEGKSV